MLNASTHDNALICFLVLEGARAHSQGTARELYHGSLEWTIVAEDSRDAEHTFAANHVYLDRSAIAHLGDHGD